VPLAGLAGARRSCEQWQAGHHHIHTGQEHSRPGGVCSTYAAVAQRQSALDAGPTKHTVLLLQGAFGYAGIGAKAAMPELPGAVQLLVHAACLQL